MEGPRRIAKACRETGVNRLIHVSALGASHDSPSAFLRSKAEGEEAVKAEFPDVTIVRPSSIFGAEDRFLSRIACELTCPPFGLPFQVFVLMILFSPPIPSFSSLLKTST